MQEKDEKLEIEQLRTGHRLFDYLPEGTLFGELSFLYQCKRTVTVVSDQYSEAAQISGADFMDLI